MPNYLWDEIAYLKKMGVNKDSIRKELELIGKKFVVSPRDNITAP